jgi:predicted negative regulator of RcsB-dependent stress response
MSADTKLILLEALLIVGAAFGFGFWQLRSVKRDQEKTRRERENSKAEESPKE